MTTLADLYQKTDHAAVTVEVRVDGSLLSEMVSADWQFGIARVPTATVRLSAPAPGAVAFFADVTIDAGFNGITTRVFTGKVMHINPDETGTTIECQGMTFALDDPFHDVVMTFSSVTAATAITNLLIAALVPDYRVTMPAWTIGVVTTPTLSFQTYGQAITKIAEVDGGRWMEMPTGTVLVQVLDPIPGFTPWRKYFSMRLSALTNAYPTGVTAADGQPRIRRIAGRQQIREVKNRATVRGAVVTQTNADGTKDPITIEQTVSQPSQWVKNPDGTQAYNVELFPNELIEDVAKAASVGLRLVNVKNRLNTQVPVTIDGDPEVSLGRTVYIGDPDYSGIEAAFFVEGYQTSYSASDFVTTLNLVGGPKAGGQANVSPFALFHHVVEREIIGDREWAILTLDARNSSDFDGSIASYSWTDNQGPPLVSGTDSVVTVRIDPATLATPYIVTLTVTDNSGATGVLSLTIDITAGATDVFIPALFLAFGKNFSGSPDGGTTWNDQAVPGGDAAISVDAKQADGTTAGIAVFGTNAGALYRTTDFCATALTLVQAALGSPFVHVWWDKNHPEDAWAVTQDGRLYRSQDDGVTWTLFDDMRIVLGKPGLRVNRVATPAPDGVWLYGGDGEGRPFVMFDPARAHAWVQAGIGGELAADLAANAVATDLYCVEAASKEAGELAILLNSATFPTALYYTADVFGDGSGWKRATGLPAKTRGRWLGPDLEQGKFAFGFDDTVVYLGDVTAGTIAVTAAAGALQAGDAANHGIWIGAFIGGIAGAYLVAAQGAVDGTLWKTWDRWTSTGKARPAVSFPAAPAGATAEMIAIGPSLLTLASERLASSGTNASPRQVSKLTTGAWTAAIAVAGITGNNPRLFCLTDKLWFITNTNALGTSQGGTSAPRRTQDAGLTWAAPGDPTGGVGGVTAFARGADGRVWCIWQNAASNTSNMSWSDDDGTSWTLSNTQGNGGFGGNHVRAWLLKCHPTNPNVVVAFVDTTLFLGLNHWGAIWVTQDRGTTWALNGQSTLRTADDSFNGRSLTILPSGRVLIAGVFPGGSTTIAVFKTDDYGATAVTSVWSAGSGALAAMYQNQNGTQVAFMYTVSNAASPRDHRLMVSTDGGSTFAQQTLPQELQTFLGVDRNIAQLAGDRWGGERLFLCLSGAPLVVRLYPVSAAGVWASRVTSYPFTALGGDPLCVIPDITT